MSRIVCRSLRLLVVALAAALFVAATAVPVLAQQRKGQGGGGFGQPPGGGMMGMMGGGADLMTLASNEVVVKELGLKEDQVKAVRELAAAYRQASMAGFDRDALFNATPEERREMMAAMREKAAKLEEEYRPKLEKAVGAKAFERLEQIQIHMAGVQAFSMPRVEEALKITQAQREEARELMQTAMTEMREEMLSNPPADREEMMERMQAMQAKMTEKVLGILTDEQKAAFDKLKGEPVDVAKIRQAMVPRGRGRQID
ncbi:hypothetical protein Isop_2201 [Isosphaera pallida ATCC 43644]|uniref:Uncharacterized protein n=1 Tax=Isosphaera pallida (strain ATCC 43644 / DSM 9630 / IS1B) TaxID=575540 RepID=E8R522_ISOPI|nr:Spy/CpxP family protein refolding chaperone [Isosphaera pallida]ADV62779.1 hypothetical protein Isop_2201 [Isosphaera pallida ATCC 43644]